LLTALLLFGAAPLSYGNVPPDFLNAKLGVAGSAVARGVGHAVTTAKLRGKIKGTQYLFLDYLESEATLKEWPA